MVIVKRQRRVLAARMAGRGGGAAVGFDAGQTTVAGLERCGRRCRGSAAKFFRGREALVARLREVKDGTRLRKMRARPRWVPAVRSHAGACCGRGYGDGGCGGAGVCGAAGRRGGDELRDHCGQREAHSATHGRATSAKLPALVRYDGFWSGAGWYCSDMTRTVHLGRASGGVGRVYRCWKRMAGVEAVAPGVSCGEVDEAARRCCDGRDWISGLRTRPGMGSGWRFMRVPGCSKAEAELEAGMVITIEPGVYMPGEFGIRIEDMVLVTARAVRC